MKRSHFAIAIGVICAVTIVRVALTHDVFSPTYDEPLHVSAGFEFLHQHYRWGTENPPLARAFFAWPLRHAHPTATSGPDYARQIYESAGDYMRGVVLSRRGNLVFVALAIIGVALFAADLMGYAAGVLAALIFAMLPTTLAYGGLATTDIAGTAAFAIAMWAVSRWLRDVRSTTTVLVGVAVALVFLTKFTVAAFLLIGVIVLMAARKRWPIKEGLAASVIALVLIYAVYTYAHAAPRFLLGMRDVIRISRNGQGAFLLGEVRNNGWWYYFPVVLFVKTPIPVLLLAPFGLKRRDVAAIALGILAIAMTSKTDIGVRHILPIYVPLSILAASALMRWRWLAAIPCAWLVVNSALAHPDYLPWMNAFAGAHPERVALDSNFDWGQDVLRLRDECARQHIPSLGVKLFTATPPEFVGVPPTHAIDPYVPDAGWCAISEGDLVPAQTRDPRAYAWLTDSRQFIRVGKTIRLYRPR